MTENQQDGPPPAPELRQRLAAEIAAGRSVSLSAEDMADPELRRQLPGMLADLTGADHGGVPPGLQVDGYTVLGAIGHGGMSTVYLARQDALGRYVALKVAAWSGADRKKRERLIQEARAMARVAHPNIVAIHDIVDVGETVAIAMEWVDGLTLEALLRALPAVPSPVDMHIAREQLGAPPEAVGNFDTSAVRYFVRVMQEIASAVHRVHEAGLLHLDIKPSNVLVRRDGTPLLADFGVVREMDLEPANTRSFAGTPIYCAPEQLRRNDRGFGPHTDVYGLGITLYEMLARRQPLKGQDLTRLVLAVEKGRIPPLGTQMSIAKDLETIVQKAMAPEPRHRYASAAELADDLDSFLEGRPVTARPLSLVQRARRWARLEPWKAALLAVLLITLPLVALLGVELLLGMHHIEEGQLRDRRQQANVLKQIAYQECFTGMREPAHSAELLHQAMQLDPSDMSLACLASMVADEDPDDVGPLLAAHPDAVLRSRGLQQLVAKAAERRAFFTPAEVAELSTSSQPVDWYVLALDRVMWAEDDSSEEAYEQAMFHIDAAAMGQEPDPLLMGIRAWVASMAGRRDQQDATCRAASVLWPDSVETMRWDCLTHELRDPEAAAATAERWVARSPDCAAAWEVLVGGFLRRGLIEQGLQQAERARAVPVSSPRLDAFYATLLTLNRREPEAKLVQATLGVEPTFAQRLRMLRVEGKEAVRQFCAERLDAPQLSRSHLETILLEFVTIGDSELVGRAFERWHRQYPDRRRMYPFEMQRVYRVRDFQGAARLAREILTPRRRIDEDSPPLCRIFATAADWPELARTAHRWLEFGGDTFRPEAAFFAGLAASRLGDLGLAARHLAMATVATHSGKPPLWYAAALLELAWLHVAPAGPAELRDPEAARRLVERFGIANPQLKSPLRGPWVKAITAEVLFANGEVDEAVATARAGLTARNEPGSSAPVDCREILRAAIERYGR